MPIKQKYVIFIVKTYMIQASQAIQHIENGLKGLLNSQQIFGKLNKSQSSVSLYLNTMNPTTPPQKTLRASNHHPSMTNMVKGKKKPWKTKNICVEFYEPQIGKNGKVKRNRFKTTVLQNAKGTIQPFTIYVYEYEAKLLDAADIPIIYNAIVAFINTGTYTDPLAGTNKAAKYISKTAKIVNKNNNQTSLNPPQQPPQTSNPTNNSSSGGLNCNIVRFTESELKRMITESIKRVIKTLHESEVDNSYKPIGGGHKFTDEDGTERTSVMTIKAPSGQMCHIAEDDHCYLLFNDDGEGKDCPHIKWIFPEAVKALQMLPLP